MRAIPRVFVLAAVLAIVASTILVGPALAAKGGKQASTLNVTLTVTTDPAPAYSTFDGYGTGFVPGNGAWLVITYPDGTTASYGTASYYDGHIAFTAPTKGPGTTKVDAYTQQMSNSGHLSALTLVGSTTFLVQ